MPNLTPREIVHELNKHIVGQEPAKKSVALALRNRWRRMQLPAEMRAEVAPKNILMIGPTGVGKTEIARRLAKLADAPFIKIEATKFTEVGYVGRDVESIIRDLVEMAIKMLREKAIARVGSQADDAAEERILDALLPAARGEEENKTDNSTRQIFRKKLREGELDDKEIEIEVSSNPAGVEIMAPPGMEEMTSQLQQMFSKMGGSGNKRTQKLRVREAYRLIRDEEAARFVNEDELKVQAIDAVENNGIVFLDEIDKVAKRGESGGTDLIPELQGRLPIRVELSALTPDDFQRILTEPRCSLTEQYKALLDTEGLNLEITDDCIRRIAEVAWQVNERTENIGARRLHTVLEKLLEEISYDADSLATQYHDKALVLDAEAVDRYLGELADDEDLSRYIL